MRALITGEPRSIVIWTCFLVVLVAPSFLPHLAGLQRPVKTVGLVASRVAVVLWSRCGELPTASPREGTGVLWVLTGTHPCDTSTLAGVVEVPDRQLALTFVVTLCGVVVHVVVPIRGGFVVQCCLVPALLLERCRLRCRSISVKALNSTFSIHGFAFVKSSSTFNLYERSWSKSTTHRSSWHFHSPHSYRTFQRILEVLRFISGQLLLRCQFALVLNDKLVETVGDLLVDLSHPSLYVVERLLVRDIVDYGDVVCDFPVEHVRRDLELTTVVQHCLNVVDFVGEEFAGTLVEVDISGCHRAHDVRAESYTLLLPGPGERSSCTGFRHVGPDAVVLPTR